MGDRPRLVAFDCSPPLPFSVLELPVEFCGASGMVAIGVESVDGERVGICVCGWWLLGGRLEKFENKKVVAKGRREVVTVIRQEMHLCSFPFFFSLPPTTPNLVVSTFAKKDFLRLISSYVNDEKRT